MRRRRFIVTIMIALGLFGLLLSAQLHAQVWGGSGLLLAATPSGPVPTAISPGSATVPDTMTSGTTIATLSVTMSNGSTFSGTCSRTDTNISGPGPTGVYTQVSGCTLETSGNYSSSYDGNHTGITLEACQNGRCVSQGFTLAVAGTATCGGETTPAIATTIGLTTCALDMTASESKFATLGNWLYTAQDNGAPGYDWFCERSYPGGLPCDSAHIFQTTDPTYSNTALAFSILLSDKTNYASSAPGVAIQGVAHGKNTSSYARTFPINSMEEFTYRNGVSQGGSPFTGPPWTSTFPDGPYTEPVGTELGAGPPPMEIVIGEMSSGVGYNTKGTGSGGANWRTSPLTDTGGWKAGNPPYPTPINTNQYNTFQLLTTAPKYPGALSNPPQPYYCYFITQNSLTAGPTGSTFNSCYSMQFDLNPSDAQNGVGQLGDRRIIIWQTVLDNGHATMAQNSLTTNQYDYVDHMRAWSCANWNTNPGGQLLSGVPYADSTASNSYACPPATNTLYGPDANGLAYWH